MNCICSYGFIPSSLLLVNKKLLDPFLEKNIIVQMTDMTSLEFENFYNYF